ncbi:MAG: PfkB family carbohydrate kinase [Desulfurococcales archaeon]|nr:PfkB family carbohydrate kinase [Desulfurococcales archaeon]
MGVYLNDERPKHIAIGNLNLDISVALDSYPEEDSHVFAREAWIGLGGAATNYAIATSKLGHRVSLVARAGGDAVKLGLLDRLIQAGVSVEYVSIAPEEPMGAVIVVLVPSNGTRTMITIRGANELLSSEHIPLDREARIYHLASVKPRIIEELCRKEWWKNGFIVSYDPGGEVYRYPVSVYNSLGCIDILMVNEKEYRAIAAAAGTADPLQLLKAGPKIIVVKQGERGALMFTVDEIVKAIIRESPPLPVDVTGAGDAFDAAFNVWLLEGRGLSEALRAAVSAGMAKVARRGSANMPSREEVEARLQKVAIEGSPL